MKSHATISWRTGRGRNACLGFALGLTLALTPSEAKSDGLVVRTNQTRGPFIVTIFTTPRISRDHPAEVNMMVQRRDSGEVMIDAKVNLSFVPPADAKPNPTEVFCGPTPSLPEPDRPAGLADSAGGGRAAASTQLKPVFNGLAVHIGRSCSTEEGGP
jgi:hypothetical protein